VFEPLLSSALLPRHSLHAPDLLGTGSSAPFDPSSSGLFFPLDWARQVESLYASLNTTSPVALVSQGGVAPVALVLAARGKIPLEKLLLLSPPTLETLTAPVPQSKFALNYRLLTFPLWKPLVVSLLSFPPLVSFFADRVLLSSPSPPFVGECVSELRRSPHAAEPVFVFNAGGLFLRSYAPEMAAATCPVAIVSGEDDSRGRIEGRMGLPEAFERAESVSLETVQGFKNVMPYEAPEALAELIGG
jgi:pimeloyl-ACP methyl ester carboxylesterase